MGGDSVSPNAAQLNVDTLSYYQGVITPDGGRGGFGQHTNKEGVHVIGTYCGVSSGTVRVMYPNGDEYLGLGFKEG